MSRTPIGAQWQHACEAPRWAAAHSADPKSGDVRVTAAHAQLLAFLNQYEQLARVFFGVARGPEPLHARKIAISSLWPRGTP